MVPLPPIPRAPDTSRSDLLALAEAAAARALPHLAGTPVPPESARGNVENLVGFAQVPIGIAGPLRVDTSAGPREVYVPLATTEGALVASYSRGMKALARGSGPRARVVSASLSQHPMLLYGSAAEAIRAARAALEEREEAERLTASITQHGRLVGLESEPIGRRVVLKLRFETGDAIGINMAAHATELVSRHVAARTGASGRYLHGEDVEKRASARVLGDGRGRTVTCDATIPRAGLAQVLRVSPEELVAIQRSYAVGFARLGTQNHLIQSANGLAALYVACGQDVAYVTESATGLLDLDVTADGDLYASVFLPSILVGTVGGGSGKGTAAECLDLLGVRRPPPEGGANVFAEIIAATLLAGDLSLLASFCTHELVDAHERLGRNRPADREA